MTHLSQLLRSFSFTSNPLSHHAASKSSPNPVAWLKWAHVTQARIAGFQLHLCSCCSMRFFDVSTFLPHFHAQAHAVSLSGID